MSDTDLVDGSGGVPAESRKSRELTMRIGFYVTLVVFLISVFFYIVSIGSGNELFILPILLFMLVPLLGAVFLWRRAYWRMRRAALEDGYE